MTDRLTVVAGDATAGSSGYVDGPGLTARFNAPLGLALSPDERWLYVADSANHAIRRVALDDGLFTVDTLATMPTGYSPRHLCTHPITGSLYFSAVKWLAPENPIDSIIGQVDTVLGSVTTFWTRSAFDGSRYGAVAINSLADDDVLNVKVHSASQWLSFDKTAPASAPDEQPDHPCSPDCPYYHRDGAFASADVGYCLGEGGAVTMDGHDYVAPSGNGICLTGNGTWGFPDCGDCILGRQVHTMASTYMNEFGTGTWTRYPGYQLAWGPPGSGSTPYQMLMATRAGIAEPCFTLIPYDEAAIGIDVSAITQRGPSAQLNWGVAYRTVNGALITSLAPNALGYPFDGLYNGTPMHTVCVLSAVADRMGSYVFAGHLGS